MSGDLSVQMIKIPVSDVQQAVAFYRDVLGLEEAFVVAEYGWAQVQAPNLAVGLYEPGKGGGDGVPGQCDSLQLIATDFGPLVARLEAAGLDPAASFSEGADGFSAHTLRDPDGNTIKVVRPPAG